MSTPPISDGTTSYTESTHQRSKTGPQQTGRLNKVSQPASSRNVIRLPARTPLSSPPSHAPTPPGLDTIVTLGGGSNKFTEADEEFFYKYIQWHRDSSLSKSTQCEKLAKLVSCPLVSLNLYLISRRPATGTSSFCRFLGVLLEQAPTEHR